MNVENFTEFQRKVQATVLAPTKSAFGLPSDLKFFRTLDFEFSEDLDACNSRIEGLAGRLLDISTKAVPKRDRIGGRQSGAIKFDDVAERLSNNIRGPLDQLLEKAVSELSFN